MWRLGNQVRCIIRISEKNIQSGCERTRMNERTNALGCRLSSLPLARQLKTKKAEVSGRCARVGFDLRRERTISDLAAEEESATYLLKQEFVVDWLRASQEQTNPPKSVLT